MKKVFAIALSLVMMCSAAYAAPSVQVEAAPTVAAATTASGAVIAPEDLAVTPVKDVTQLPAEVAAELQQAHQEIVSAPSVEQFIANAGLEQAVETALETFNAASAAADKVAAKDLAVHSMFDVSATGAAKKELEENGSVTITFALPELKAGQVAIVLHMAKNGWEVVPSSTANGAVSATFTSLSPVVILVEDAVAAAPGVTSPQTGDVNLELVLVSGAVLSAAALAFCLKRREMV